MGARELRSEDDLRRPYQDRTTTQDSVSKPVEVELRSLKQDSSSDEHVFSYPRTGLKLTTFRHPWEAARNRRGSRAFGFTICVTRLRLVSGRGVHEMDIMTLLGHTTLQTPSRYT